MQSFNLIPLGFLSLIPRFSSPYRLKDCSITPYSNPVSKNFKYTAAATWHCIIGNLLIKLLKVMKYTRHATGNVILFCY